MLLKQLSNAFGVSGCEGEVRDIVVSNIKPYCDSIDIDSMGNVIAYKKGKNSSKRIMLAAHLDEIGFIICSITDGGYLKFKTVGGIDSRVLVGKRVTVGKKKINGVIALRAIHLQKKLERETAVEVENLFIDIGAKNKEEAQKLVELGDYATFNTEFSEFGDNLFKGKALDDRAGCAVLIELLKNNSYKDDIYACFTVQEEVGCRGAKIAANRIKPHLAIVIECTICADVAGAKPQSEVTTLGGGATFTLMDSGTYADKELTQNLYDLAKSLSIPVQYKRSVKGGNDAASIHQSETGVPCAAIALPCRYLHSPVSIISKSDYNAVYNIVFEFLNRL